jgi:transposase-like protein
MRPREKLTLEEKVSIALELIKRDRSLEEIREHYRVSHTTAYKIRNLFLDGGRRALGRGEERQQALEERVRALEERVGRDDGGFRPPGVRARRSRAATLNGES